MYEVRRQDVMSAWYGIRPLAVDPNAKDHYNILCYVILYYTRLYCSVLFLFCFMIYHSIVYYIMLLHDTTLYSII